MHILLYLDDLTPLERVFNIRMKKKSSAFLRSHAVNKKLTHVSSSARKGAYNQSKDIDRRNNALNRLHSIDTDSLEALLAMHDRSLGINKN